MLKWSEFVTFVLIFASTGNIFDQWKILTGDHLLSPSPFCCVHMSRSTVYISTSTLNNNTSMLWLHIRHSFTCWVHSKPKGHLAYRAIDRSMIAASMRDVSESIRGRQRMVQLKKKMSRIIAHPERNDSRLTFSCLIFLHFSPTEHIRCFRLSSLIFSLINGRKWEKKLLQCPNVGRVSKSSNNDQHHQQHCFDYLSTINEL